MSHHTLLHRSLGPAVSGLARLRVTPDQVTMLRLLTGLGSAVCLLQGRAGLAWGGGLFLLSTLLDRVDGTLARQTGQVSALGGRFDLVADCLSTMGFFIALGIGRENALISDLVPRALSPILGFSAALSVAILFRQLARQRQEEDPNLVRSFDPDDVMVLLPGLLWCGFSGSVLLAAGIVSPITVVALWWAGRRRALS